MSGGAAVGETFAAPTLPDIETIFVNCRLTFSAVKIRKSLLRQPCGPMDCLGRWPVRGITLLSATPPTAGVQPYFRSVVGMRLSASRFF